VSEDNSPAASYDAPKVAADSYPHSRNRDNVYATFTSFDFTCGPKQDQYCQSPVYGSMSTDHGLTWSTPEQISGRNPDVCQFGNAFDPKLPADSCNLDGHSDIQVLPNGDLALTFISQNSPGQSPQILAEHCRPSGSSSAGSAHLHCGTPQRIVIEQVAHAPQCDLGAGPEQCSPGAFIRVPFETSQRLAVDERSGALYDSWYDYRRGEFDIFVSRSSDGGRTWSPARRVNPDSGTDHYFAAIDVAERGPALGVGYFRTGRVPHENQSPKNGFTKSDPGVARRLSDYVLASGRPLSTPFAFDVLSPRFPAPDGNQEGFNGDYSGISISHGNVAHVVWSDTRVRVHEAAINGASVDEDVYTDARRIGRGGR
jgi:hypothetical protein